MMISKSVLIILSGFAKAQSRQTESHILNPYLRSLLLEEYCMVTPHFTQQQSPNLMNEGKTLISYQIPTPNHIVIK